ncbi:MAG: carbohydrate ABC transporter permease [Chloroflexi bacterium]|uniref:carbohydrate ABC transporter permease n=1 Tax=Candidatus Flexifilum breve TaxID=3140694 RepID=UPI0031348D30|nr:carbohydrate ABC transporter permease [Chloroflexota bacterium]
MATVAQPNPTTQRPKFSFWRGVIYAVCIILALLFLFPIVWTAISSVKPPSEASAAPPTFLPSRIDFGNYIKLNDYGRGVWNYVGNSVGTAIMTVIGSTILSTLAGYGFSRFRFPAKNLMFVLILMTLMIPFQSILIPLFLILTGLKLQNTLFGLALVYITFQLPFGVFIMRNSFDTVPREIEEAALLDGCTPFTMLYRVMLNIVRPGIITVGIYAFLNSWNEFLAALIFMTKETSFTLPILLTSVRSGYYGAIDWGALQAGLMVTIVPCVVIFLLLQRYYVVGLTGGATKG